MSLSQCSFKIFLFMFLLQMIMYPLIELETMKKFNYRNDLLIRKTTTNFWTDRVWEFSGIFFAKIWDLISD
jgi:hypothetical protein